MFKKYLQTTTYRINTQNNKNTCFYIYMRLEIQCVLFWVDYLHCKTKNTSSLLHLFASHARHRKTNPRVTGHFTICKLSFILLRQFSCFSFSLKNMEEFACFLLETCLVNHWGNTWFQVIAGTLPNCSSSPTVRKLAIAPVSLRHHHK